MEQEQDATRGSTGSNRGSCRRLKTCTSSVQGFKTIEAFRAEKIMEVMWNMSEATVVEAIVVEAMADSREAGEETIDEAMIGARGNDRRGYGERGGERGRARERDHGPSSRGATPDRTSRSRSTERYSSQLPEQRVIANRPAHSEAKLLQAGFGQADRVHGNTGERRDAVVVHLCANCDYLDYSLQQQLRSQAHMHSMDTCMRPGGGAHGESHEEARTRQYALDDMLLRSQSMSGSNARSQRSQQLRQSGGTEDTGGDHKATEGWYNALI